MAAGLAVMLVAGLSTIQYLSDPFAGSGAIKPHEMQRTIALMENAKSPVLDLSTVPCDAAGARPKVLRYEGANQHNPHAQTDRGAPTGYPAKMARDGDMP